MRITRRNIREGSKRWIQQTGENRASKRVNSIGSKIPIPGFFRAVAARAEVLGIGPGKGNRCNPALCECVFDASSQVRNAWVLEVWIHNIRARATELGAAEFVDVIRDSRGEQVREARGR